MHAIFKPQLSHLSLFTSNFIIGSCVVFGQFSQKLADGIGDLIGDSTYSKAEGEGLESLALFEIVSGKDSASEYLLESGFLIFLSGVGLKNYFLCYLSY